MKYIIIVHNIEFMGDGKQTFLVESETPKKVIIAALTNSLPVLSEQENFTGHIVELETTKMWVFVANVGGNEDIYKIKKIHWFSIATETGFTHKHILDNFPLIKDTGAKIKSSFPKLKNYKHLKKLYKTGHKFLIVTGVDMRFENLIWNFLDVSFYTRQLYEKGKRVSIIVLKSNQVITMQYPLMIEHQHLERFLNENEDIKIFSVRFE